MGLWKSKFKQRARESGVTVNQSTRGKDVAVLYPYGFGYPVAQLHCIALLPTQGNDGLQAEGPVSILLPTGGRGGEKKVKKSSALREGCELQWSLKSLQLYPLNEQHFNSLISGMIMFIGYCLIGISAKHCQSSP